MLSVVYNLKVLQTISSIDLSRGGPSKSVLDLSYHLVLAGCDVTVFTNKSSNPYEIKSSNIDLNVILNEKSTFNVELARCLNKYLIVHGHGIWQMPVHYMSEIAREKNIPYLISPRGMLEPWSLSQKSVKKKLAMLLYQRKDLANAACIHATSKMEAENIRKLGFNNPIAVIPNSIEIEPLLERQKPKGAKRKVFFLSRIHRKKGIELLLEAWSKIDYSTRSNWIVEIVGNGDEGYIHQLKKRIASLNLQQEISILGPQFDKDKQNSFLSSDLFVLPTFSENFGLVIAEAMSYGLPIITTKGTPWQELDTHNAGWWIDIGVEPLMKTLVEAMNMKPGELELKGKNGRKLVEQNYNIEVVSTQMIALYNWILGKGTKPDFVYD